MEENLKQKIWDEKMLNHRCGFSLESETSKQKSSRKQVQMVKMYNELFTPLEVAIKAKGVMVRLRLVFLEKSLILMKSLVLLLLLLVDPLLLVAVLSSLQISMPS